MTSPIFWDFWLLPSPLSHIVQNAYGLWSNITFWQIPLPLSGWRQSWTAPFNFYSFQKISELNSDWISTTQLINLLSFNFSSNFYINSRNWRQCSYFYLHLFNNGQFNLGRTSFILLERWCSRQNRLKKEKRRKKELVNLFIF